MIVEEQFYFNGFTDTPCFTLFRLSFAELKSKKFKLSGSLTHFVRGAEYKLLNQVTLTLPRPYTKSDKYFEK